MAKDIFYIKEIQFSIFVVPIVAIVTPIIALITSHSSSKCTRWVDRYRSSRAIADSPRGSNHKSLFPEEWTSSSTQQCREIVESCARC